MEIKQINGNLLTSNYECICHQVNCQGVMNGGIAKQIREKNPKVYNEYKKLCNQYLPQELLGAILTTKSDDGLKYIINLFGQLNYGRNGQYTDYKAFENALKHIKEHCKIYNIKNIAFPYGIGCGLGGGDWNTIYNLIISVFENTDYNIFICKL